MSSMDSSVCTGSADAVASLPFDVSRVPLSVSREIGGGGDDGDADFAAHLSSSEHLLSEGRCSLPLDAPLGTNPLLHVVFYDVGSVSNLVFCVYPGVILLFLRSFQCVV